MKPPKDYCDHLNRVDYRAAYEAERASNVWTAILFGLFGVVAGIGLAWVVL